jgi:hypothetical protein
VAQSLFLSSSNASLSATTTAAGRNSNIWEQRTSTLRPATKLRISNLSRFCRTTSRVLTPIEPVDPKTVTRVTYPRPSHTEYSGPTKKYMKFEKL